MSPATLLKGLEILIMYLRRILIFSLLVSALAVIFGVSAAQESSSITPANSNLSIPARYIFNAWDTDDGLPQISVNSIVQTRDGYLWLATYGGLVRFNGVNFKVFEVGNSEGLKSNRITDLYEDREGALWIGTEMGGVSQFKDGRFTSYTMRDGLPSDNIGAIMQDRHGNIWMCSGEGLIRLKNGKFTVYTKRDGLPDIVVNSLTEDNEGNLWIATRSGLTRMSPEGQFTVYTTANGLPYDNVRSLLKGRNGKIWVGTFTGLASFDGERFTIYNAGNELSDKLIRCLAEDAQGNLWIGTSEKGLYRLTPSGQVTRFSDENGLSDRETRTIFEDAEQNLWIGTNTGGLNRMRQGKAIAYTREDGLPADSVVPITEDTEGNLWIGTTCGGLVSFRDGRFTTYTKRDGLPSDCVWSLLADRDGSLWIGTWDGGLTHFQNGKFTTYNSANSRLTGDVVLALFQDSKGTIWIGTTNGLNRYENGEFTALRTGDGLVHDDVRFITESREGSLWIGTTGGFSRFKDGKFTNYTTAEGLSHNFVRAIYEDGDGTLWLGTYGGGLNRFRDGQFTHYNTNIGLFDNVVSRILEDSRGNLWMSGNRGIFRASRTELNDYAEKRRSTITSVSYGVGDGMANHETNGGGQPAGWKTRDGRLWFPTVKGPVVIDPERIVSNERPPPVHIEGMFFDKKPVDYKGQLELPNGKGELQINYTGLSFVVPEKVKFKYRLLGSSKDEWNEVGTRREAYYTDLSPGKYQFQVIAANNDGVWNEEGAALEFNIPPAFYQTNWFYFLCFATAGCLIWLGYQRHVRQVRARLALQYEERLNERTRIAQDLHDTLLQGFLSTSMQLHVADDKLPDDSPAKPQIKRVLEIMKQVIEEGRNAVRGLRSDGQDSLSLEEALSRVPQKLTSHEQTAFKVVVEGRARPLYPITQDEVYRIGHEALMNAFRHAKAGNIEVTVEYSGSHLRLLVTDDGRGINSKVLQSGREGHWGLSGMRERAKKIGAQLKVRSRDGAGTEIELFVPGRIAFEKESNDKLNWFSRLSARKSKEGGSEIKQNK
jgi:ligand-binding sensor domain-containing protein/signal transduction histidine kinase